MGKLVATFILTLLIAVMALMNFFYDNYEYEQDKARAAMAHAAKVLNENYYIEDGLIFDDLDDIKIDEEKLLLDFDNCLFDNYFNYETYTKTRKSIRAKVLVYQDYFIISSSNNVWSAPYYFWYEAPGGQMVYLNTKDSKTVYYNSSNVAVEGVIADFGLTSEQKTDLIINRLNDVLGAYTLDRGNLVNVKVQNPYNLTDDYKREYQSFNVLDGVTFYVIYDNENELFIFQEMFRIDSTEIVGYTLDLKNINY